MQTHVEKRYYTPAEYLEMEEKAKYKSEYRDGEIVPMAGGSINHNRITRNLGRVLDRAFRGHDSEVFMNDLRLWIPQDRRYFYLDVMVIEGMPVFYEERRDIVLNPVLIAEVLSKSTKNYDRGEKFEYYRSIPELKEYITIDQSRFHIEQFAKTAENQWLFTEYLLGEALLKLAAIDFQISLAEIYDRVSFERDKEF